MKKQYFFLKYFKISLNVTYFFQNWQPLLWECFWFALTFLRISGIEATDSEIAGRVWENWEFGYDPGYDTEGNWFSWAAQFLSGMSKYLKEKKNLVSLINDNELIAEMNSHLL